MVLEQVAMATVRTVRCLELRVDNGDLLSDSLPTLEDGLPARRPVLCVK
jgi:hypothetical protein